jgi:hypothetical protein
MRGACRYVFAIGLVFGITLSAPLALSGIAASESDGRNGGNETSSGRDGRNGDDGGSETVYDVGNVWEDDSCSVTIGDITTGDVTTSDGFDQAVTVYGCDGDPSSVVNSIPGTAVIIIAPSGSATAGTSGGNINADASAGEDGQDGESSTGSDGSDGSDGDDATSTAHGDDSNQ